MIREEDKSSPQIAQIIEGQTAEQAEEARDTHLKPAE